MVIILEPQLFQDGLLQRIYKSNKGNCLELLFSLLYRIVTGIEATGVKQAMGFFLYTYTDTQNYRYGTVMTGMNRVRYTALIQ